MISPTEFRTVAVMADAMRVSIELRELGFTLRGPSGASHIITYEEALMAKYPIDLFRHGIEVVRALDLAVR